MSASQRAAEVGYRQRLTINEPNDIASLRLHLPTSAQGQAIADRTRVPQAGVEEPDLEITVKIQHIGGTEAFDCVSLTYVRRCIECA